MVSVSLESGGPFPRGDYGGVTVHISPGAPPVAGVGQAFLGKHSEMGREGITSLRAKGIWVSIETASLKVP